MDWKKLKDNPDYWRIFKKRAEIIDRIRQFFKKEGFLEVQTPILTPSLIPESYLEVFETELRDKLGKSKRAYLSTSPEMWLKKLLVAGSGNVFEITKSFRNTDIGGHFHNPEFTMLEWYRVNADYKDTMDDCENLIRFVNDNNPQLTYQGKTIDVNKPFERITVIEAFKKYAKIDEEILFDRKKLISEAVKRGNGVSLNDDWETVFNLLYLNKVEPNLGQTGPTIIYDFPAQFAPLSKTSKTDPRLKERFELYIFGVELADAYNELTDWEEQKKQFEKEIELRKISGKKDHKADWDFIEALKSGLPDCSGVALGVDRLLMLYFDRNKLVYLDKVDINKVMLFSGEEIFKI